MRKFWIFLCSVLLLYIYTPPGSAQENQQPAFDTTYNIEYFVDTSLEVSVTENIAIINQTASAAPSSFFESITNISVYDIKVYDSKVKELVPEIEEENKSLIIKIPIENPAIGQDKQTKLVLTYKTRDLAQKTGRILTVTVPKAPVSNLMQEYNVTLKIPRDFGPQISITPRPMQETMEEEGYVLHYNKQTLEQFGISATFGDYQIFDFELSDQLTNTSFFSRNFKVALPPPINDYQEIAVTELEPKPDQVVTDHEGNVLAVYKVGGKKSLSITAKGKAKVYNRKVDYSIPNESGKVPNHLKKYISPTEHWPTKANEITEVVNHMSSVQDVYSYITKNIKYDYESADSQAATIRKGPIKTLADKNGLCLDYTDVFITLSRTLGIPAREVDGYAYTRDQKASPTPLGLQENITLHSWAQYYHSNYGWVAVDPTWGATSGLDFLSKLDNNHLAFVIRGGDPQNLRAPKYIKVNFSGDDYFSQTSLYDLENLPKDDFATTNGLLLLTGVLALGLCTIFLGLKARAGGR